MLGLARDAAVIREHFDAAVHAELTALVFGPVRRRIGSTLNRDHREAHQRALAAMTSARYLDPLDELEAIDHAVTDAKRPDVAPGRSYASTCGERTGGWNEPSTRR